MLLREEKKAAGMGRAKLIGKKLQQGWRKQQED